MKVKRMRQIQITKSHDEGPLRILQDDRQGDGELKYLVQYNTSKKWQLASEFQQLYMELIDDYYFYKTTEQRFDKSMLQDRAAILQKVLHYQHPLQKEQENKQLHRSIKGKIKAAEKVEPNKILITVDKLRTKQLKIESKQQRIIESNNQPNIIPEIAQKSFQQSYQLIENIANKNDDIESIDVINISETQHLFQVNWKLRQNGIKPISETYSYQQMKIFAPMLLLQCFEEQILECYSQNTYHFECPGDVQQKLCMFKQMLKPL